jgi:hypothetical protein
MSKLLVEGLDYHDLVNQMVPEVSIDEYSAKMGEDDEIVTLAFVMKSHQAAEDVVDWFERGYEWILDAQVSEGEVSPGKYLVFVEMSRRTSVPDRVVELIDDLETLTSLKIKDWTIKINGEDFDADAEQIKTQLILSPHKYREEKETDLNEVRHRAGLEPHKIFKEQDSLLKDFISKAGL